MRILIDENDDIKDRGYALPWERDSNCFNFMAPERYVHPDMISDIKRPSYVESLVIACDMPDYTFISKFRNLKQLYIYSGNNLFDLTFLESLVKLNQICILDSHISTLDSLKCLIDKKESLFNSAPNKEKLKAQFAYGVDGIYICSDASELDGTELLREDICRNEINVNNHFIKS